MSPEVELSDAWANLRNLLVYNSASERDLYNELTNLTSEWLATPEELIQLAKRACTDGVPAVQAYIVRAHLRRQQLEHQLRRAGMMRSHQGARCRFAGELVHLVKHRELNRRFEWQVNLACGKVAGNVRFSGIRRYVDSKQAHLVHSRTQITCKACLRTVAYKEMLRREAVRVQL